MINFKKTILLTGAGFTANFGGFLAKEMWARIFNNPALNNAGNVKLELKKDFDFESIYSTVFDRRFAFPTHEIKILESVLNEVYLLLDQTIKQPQWESLGIHQADLNRFLEYFRENSGNETAVCFTLNQDLFLERHFGWQPLGTNAMRYKGNFGNLDINDIDSNNAKLLPSHDELESYKDSFSESFTYIKLHGSQKWITSDGKDTKILGINKAEVIEKIPLLKWYFELFQQALFRNDVRLVVIGYSFRDRHINEQVIKAINEHNLKLFVISTENPESFYFRMTHKYPSGSLINDINEQTRVIWNAIEGYFPYRLKDIFPYHQHITAKRIEIYRAIDITT